MIAPVSTSTAAPTMLNPLELRKAAKNVIADLGEKALRAMDDMTLRKAIADTLPELDSSAAPRVASVIKRILTPIHMYQESAEDIVNKMLDVDEAFTINPPPGYDGKVFTAELKSPHVELSNLVSDTLSLSFGEKASVKFTLDEDWRSWGLKAITPSVQSIHAVYSTEDDAGEEQSHELMVTSEEFDITVTGGKRIPCTPTDVYIDLKQKTATVEFGSEYE